MVAAIACAAPRPSSSPTSEPTVAASPTSEPTLAASPTPAAPATIPIRVQFRGDVNCNIGFSFYCAPYLSVLEPGTELAASWRPAAGDASWATRGDDMQPVGGRRWTLLRGSPAAGPGRHLVVISLIGTSDLVSYNPDGSVATELLGRCAATLDVAPDAEAVEVLVTFESEASSTAATCRVEVSGP